MIDVFVQIAEWYKVAKRASEVSAKLQVEIDYLKEMETQNEKIISNLTLKLENEKKARAEDARRVETQRKKIEDSRTTLYGDVELSNHKNHVLSKEIKHLKAQLKEENKAKDETLVQSQELCDRILNAEVQRDEALKKV